MQSLLLGTHSTPAPALYCTRSDGTMPGTADFVRASGDRCHDHDYRLSQFASYLQFSYTAAGKCQTAIFASLPLDSSLTHVVVSFTNSSTSAVYIKEESVSTFAFYRVYKTAI